MDLYGLFWSMWSGKVKFLIFFCVAENVGKKEVRQKKRGTLIYAAPERFKLDFRTAVVFG